MHFWAISKHPRPRLGWRGWLLFLGLSSFVGYALGLAAFIAWLPTPYTTLPPALQGVAVFTGGAGRVAEALRLVQQGFNGPVLISGVNPRSQLPEIAEVAALPTPLTAAQQQQIMLDGAATTRENLQSLKLWAATSNLQHIGVITSTYHAARVQALGWWLAPELHLTLLPIQPEDTSFGVLLREYHKLLALVILR